MQQENEETKPDNAVVEDKSESGDKELGNSQVESPSKSQLNSPLTDENKDVEEEWKNLAKEYEELRVKSQELRSKTRANWCRDYIRIPNKETDRKYQGPLLMDTLFPYQSRLCMGDPPELKELNFEILKIPPFVTRNFNQLYSLENWGGANFDVLTRFVKLITWRRVEILRKFIPDIPFQMVLVEANKRRRYSNKFVNEFCDLAIKCGMVIFRVFDSSNYIPNLILGMKAASKAGGIVETGISYRADVTSHEKYNLDYYVNLAAQLIEAGAQFLVIKDVAGLLTRSAATLLVSALSERHPNIPISVHKQDTASVGVSAMLVCADVNDVAIDFMLGHTSQRNLGAVVASLQDSGYGIDWGDKFSVYTAYWQQSTSVHVSFCCEMKAGVGTYEFIPEILGRKFHVQAKNLESKVAKCMDDVERCFEYTKVTEGLMSKKIEIEKNHKRPMKRKKAWVKYMGSVEGESWFDLVELILNVNDYPKDFNTPEAIAENIDDIYQFVKDLSEANLDK